MYMKREGRMRLTPLNLIHLISNALAKCITSGDGWNLRLLLLLIQCRYQTSDAVLELAVLGGINERIDAAVGEHQYRTQMIQPASEVDTVSEKVEKEDDFVWCPAHDKSAAHHQWRN